MKTMIGTMILAAILGFSAPVLAQSPSWNDEGGRITIIIEGFDAQEARSFVNGLGGMDAERLNSFTSNNQSSTPMQRSMFDHHGNPFMNNERHYGPMHMQHHSPRNGFLAPDRSQIEQWFENRTQQRVPDAGEMNQQKPSLGRGPDSQPIYTPPHIEETVLCDADKLEALVGGPLPRAEDLRAQRVAETVRVLVPGQGYTLDLRRERANIIIDANRDVVDAYCG